MKLPICMQIQPGENGLAVLQCILAYNKKFVRIDVLRTSCKESRNGLTPEQVVESGKQFGLKGCIQEKMAEDLIGIKTPFIICWRRHYFAVVQSINRKYVKLMDPSKGLITVTFEKFEQSYTKKAIFLEPDTNFVRDGKKETAVSLLKTRLMPYAKWLVFFVVIDIVIALLGYFYLQTQTKFIDQTMGVEYDAGKYTKLLIILVSLFISKVVFEVWKTLSNFSVSRKMAANSASDLFSRLLKMPAVFYEQHSLGELTERLDNNATLDRNLVQQLIPRIIDLGMSIFYIVLMYTYSPILASACLLFEIVHIVIMLAIQRKAAVLSRSQVSSSGSMNASAFNCFNNIDTIKSMGSERYYFNVWNKSRNEYQKDQTKNNNLTLKIDFLTHFHNSLMSAMFLFLGAILVIESQKTGSAVQFTLGMLSTFQSIFNIVKKSFTEGLSTENAIQKARTHIERAEDIRRRQIQEEHPLKSGDEPDKLKCELEVKNINFRYHSGDPLILKDVSIKVKQGEMVALVGSSGCGKSTLSKIIAGIYKQESGEVLYDGKPREEIPDIVFRSSISSVDQEVCIFDSSISNNLKMWDDTVENFEMILAANDAHIHSRIVEEPKGYDTVMQPDGSNFSGGEIQRLELARALSQEPTLLLLDEFTSALDAITEEKIFNSVRMKGTSCIVIAHRLSTIVNCDRIYVMDHGEIIEQGTHKELMALKGYYHELVSKQ